MACLLQMSLKDERDEQDMLGLSGHGSRIQLHGISLNSANVLPEDVLRNLSRDLGLLAAEDYDRVEPHNSQDQLEFLLGALIRTAESTHLSVSHSAIACNVLSGFLEQGLVSKSSLLRGLCCASSTWQDVFQLYLCRSEGGLVKPMRHMMSTLGKILAHVPDGQGNIELTQYAVDSTIDIVCGRDAVSAIKPASQLLEYLISKKIIGTSQLLQSFKQSPDFNQVMHSQRPKQSSISLSEYHSLPADQSIYDITRLASRILRWILCAEFAPTIGRLFSSFFQSLREYNNPCTLTGDVPLWLPSVKTMLHRDSAYLAPIETHLLPSLLLQSPEETLKFLHSLPFENLCLGNARAQSTTDIRLCLVAAKIHAGSRATKKYYPLNEAVEDDNAAVSYNPQKIGLKLLEHEDVSVRNAALSASTFSTSSSRPFPAVVLKHLVGVLPTFHCEVDIKYRNEFIAGMKKILTRLRIAMLSLQETAKSLEKAFDLQDAANQDLSVPPELEDDAKKVQEIRLQHCSFLSWYEKLILTELHPMASYQRHITALKIIPFILQNRVTSERQSNMSAPRGSSKSDVPTFLFDLDQVKHFVRPLLDLMMNPFDDVRLHAAYDLKLVFKGLSSLPEPASNGHETLVDIFTPCGVFGGDLVLACDRAAAFMHRTGRADHADGMARLYELSYESMISSDLLSQKPQRCNHIFERLMSRLEDDIAVAKRSIHEAVGIAPLHGWLITLRYLMSHDEFWQYSFRKDSSLESRLLYDCREIWHVIKDILCFDSPEGHSIYDVEEEELGIGTKDTLSFAWRALKESSLLMQAFILNHKPALSDRGQSYDIIASFGKLAFTQLAELRHRGAFSTVSKTFTACCTRCVKDTDPAIVELPKKWCEDALACIEQKASALTRRSAGLPSLIIGILEAHIEDDFFDRVLQDLQMIANSPPQVEDGSSNPRLPQVHALNCLKNIFTNTILGPRSEKHLAATLDIAFSSLESHIWAIQNCGLMLFRSLLTRLAQGGGDISSKDRRSRRHISSIAYRKYLNLPELVLGLFRSLSSEPKGRHIQPQSRAPHSDEASQATRIFPALEIIERLGMPDRGNAEVSTQLNFLLQSSDWAIREKAAKVIMSITTIRDIPKKIQSLLEPQWVSQNQLHGRLLCVRHLLAHMDDEVFTKLPDQAEIVFHSIASSFDSIVASSKCPFTAATFVEIVSDTLVLLKALEISDQADDVSTHSTSFVQPIRAKLVKECQKILENPQKSKQPSWSLLKQALARGLGVCSRSGRAQPLLGVEEDLTAQGLDALNIDEAVKILNGWKIADWASQAQGHTISFKALSDENEKRAGQMKENHGVNLEACNAISPQEHENALVMEGVRLGQNFAYEVRDETFPHQLKCWMTGVRLAVNEFSEFPLRLAAIQSVEGFLRKAKLFEKQDFLADDFLALYLVLYDALNDDDEEVRDLAARVVSTFLSDMSRAEYYRWYFWKVENLSLSPVKARNLLLQFIISNHKGSVLLKMTAVQRVTGLSLPLDKIDMPENEAYELLLVEFDSQTPEYLLQEARQEDNALFVEEKQNLYVDPVDEAWQWAEVLTNLYVDDIDETLRWRLAIWALSGVSVLKKLSKNEFDGPLGWASKPEVFTLGMRIFCAVKADLDWHLRTGSQLDYAVSVMRLKQLRELEEAGRKNGMHDVWILGMLKATEGSERHLERWQREIDEQGTFQRSEFFSVLSWVRRDRLGSDAVN